LIEKFKIDGSSSSVAYFFHRFKLKFVTDSQSEFSALEEEMLGIDSSASVRTGTTGKTSSRGVDEKQREQLRKLERNRKENMEVEFAQLVDNQF